MKEHRVLLDVMIDNQFICQLRYFGRPFPVMRNGQVTMDYDERDIKRFIEEKRPSLVGKNYYYEFAKQLVFNR